MLARAGIKRVDKICRFHLISGTPEHTFEWGGAGDELQAHMGVCNIGGSRDEVGGQGRSA